MKVQEHVFVFFTACLFGMSFVAADSSEEEEMKISAPMPSMEDMDETLDELDSLTDIEDLLPPSMNTDVSSSDEINSVYDFTVKDLNGNDVSLSKYRGRVLVIVNYANICGFTLLNEYRLSMMAKKYGDKLAVLMFPSNSFYQFIGGNSAAQTLKNNHPEFEVFSEISVTGSDMHPLYKYLTRQLPDFLGESIKWNFTKFVIDRNGRPVRRLIFLAAVCKTVKKLMSTEMDYVDDDSAMLL